MNEIDVLKCTARIVRQDTPVEKAGFLGEVFGSCSMEKREDHSAVFLIAQLCSRLHRKRQTTLQRKLNKAIVPFPRTMLKIILTR